MRCTPVGRKAAVLSFKNSEMKVNRTAPAISSYFLLHNAHYVRNAMPAQSELDLPHVISIREWMSASQCDEKKILSTLFPLQRGPGRSFHWSVCPDVREEAGRVGLIDVVCSGSLLRDRDRQLRGVWMSNRDDRRTTAKSHAPSTGKSLLVIISETWMLGIHSSTGTINGRQRHLAVCVCLRYSSGVWQKKERFVPSACQNKLQSDT